MSKPGKVHFEQITLSNDNGAECTFNGRLFSESSYYDEDSMTLTRLRLYISDRNEQVYSIISGSGQEKTRRFYVVAQEGDLYRISNGAHTLRLPLDILFASVFGLCGITPDRAEELRPDFEESLRMIVG
jgi:hypothetical protein